jgi:predicted dehydrogenase
MSVGIVGCGLIAHSHAESLQELGVAVTSLYDLDRAQAESLARVTGATVADDWRALLDRGDLDAVLVCTPPRAHREAAVGALERGISLYLEKPIARDLEDARVIAEAAARTGTCCAIGYQWSALEWLDELAAQLREEKIGIISLRQWGGTAGRSWFVEQAAGGGQILERASHAINMLLRLAGPVSAVHASGARVPLAGGDRPAESDIDDVLVLTFELERGGLGSVQTVWQAMELPASFDCQIVTDKNRYTLDVDPHYRLSTPEGTQTVKMAPSVRSLERLLAGEPCCTPAQALAVLEVALEAERALTR